MPLTSRIFIEKTEDVKEFLAIAKNFKVEYNDENEDCIDLDVLIELVTTFNNQCQQHQLAPIHLHKILCNSQVVRRTNLPNSKWDELSELEKMRLKAEERHYLKSVRKSLRYLRDSTDIQDTLAGSMKSLGMAINLILGLFLTFLAGYFLACYAGFSESPTIPAVVGIFFSIGYIVVEVMLIILYDYKLYKKMQLDAVTRMKGIQKGAEPESCLLASEHMNSLEDKQRNDESETVNQLDMNSLRDSQHNNDSEMILQLDKISSRNHEEIASSTAIDQQQYTIRQRK